MRVCHLTSVHDIYDVRIYHKEATILSAAGYEVVIVAPCDNCPEMSKIQFSVVPKPKTRFHRITRTLLGIYWAALKEDADLYHFHDAELIPIALNLKKRGKIVIYDVHEDLPRQIVGKPYIRKFLKPFISKIVEIIEEYSVKKFDAIVCATPYISDRFMRLNPTSIDINNFPIKNEFHSRVGGGNKGKQVCYVGGITRIRGLKEIILAISLVPDVTLLLCGKFEGNVFEDELRALPGWRQVRYFGEVGREKVREIMSESCAGLVTFLPAPNHIYSQPNKMFEYMSASLAVIASNFPLWSEIVNGNMCGVCVDPQSPEEIAEAIRHLVNDKEFTRQMGERGRKAIEQRYNWTVEAKKLLELYRILGSRL